MRRGRGVAAVRTSRCRGRSRRRSRRGRNAGLESAGVRDRTKLMAMHTKEYRRPRRSRGRPVFEEYPRRSRGGAATRLRGIPARPRRSLAGTTRRSPSSRRSTSLPGRSTASRTPRASRGRSTGAAQKSCSLAPSFERTPPAAQRCKRQRKTSFVSRVRSGRRSTSDDHGPRNIRVVAAAVPRPAPDGAGTSRRSSASSTASTRRAATSCAPGGRHS